MPSTPGRAWEHHNGPSALRGLEVAFEHDGAPFTSEELAALLSGGSSKEFESEITTGRFGTGFLVTHVLAERTTLRGLLRVPRGCELFELTLDRSGDEDAILRNSRSCNEAIRLARAVKGSTAFPLRVSNTPLATTARCSLA